LAQGPWFITVIFQIIIHRLTMEKIQFIQKSVQ